MRSISIGAGPPKVRSSRVLLYCFQHLLLSPALGNTLIVHDVLSHLQVRGGLLDVQLQELTQLVVAALHECSHFSFVWVSGTGALFKLLDCLLIDQD